MQAVTITLEIEEACKLLRPSKMPKMVFESWSLEVKISLEKKRDIGPEMHEKSKQKLFTNVPKVLLGFSLMNK
jgi:hypothetical protein